MKYKPERDLPRFVRQEKTFSPTKLILLGEIYKNAHELGMKTNDPDTIEICEICNRLAQKWQN